jgi:hypothetical protein
LVISHPFSAINDITHHFEHHRYAQSPISLVSINDDSIPDEEFWSLLDFLSVQLEPNGCIAISNINKTVDSRLRWKQIENDEKFQVTIDLFGMGLIFVRKEQIKEAFLLRY